MSGRVGRTLNRRSWPFAAVGVGVAFVLVFALGPVGILPHQVTVCRLGAEVGTYLIWTPISLLNKPPGVNDSTWVYGPALNYTFSSGSLVVGALPTGPFHYGGGGRDYDTAGGLDATYQNHHWTFYQTTNMSESGTSSLPCTQRYVALMGGSVGCGGESIIPLLNGSNDTIEPHVWNGTAGVNGSEAGCAVQTPGTYVRFDTSFDGNGSGISAAVNWNLCQLHGNSTLVLAGTAQIPVVVTVPYQGHDISATGSLEWYGLPHGQNNGVGLPTFTATWTVPDGWDYTLAPVGPATFTINPDLPLPSLVAFEVRSC
jgi:hypothetical protein